MEELRGMFAVPSEHSLVHTASGELDAEKDLAEIGFGIPRTNGWQSKERKVTVCIIVF